MNGACMQGEGVVYVSSTMHRTFGLGDWQQLYTLLTSWKENLNTVKEQLAHVASTQVANSLAATGLRLDSYESEWCKEKI